jgi:DNA-3-methyladenine glycosylase
MKKLELDFYRRENVLEVARDLIGKILVTKWEGVTTSGRIVECEAYAGITDRASHAYSGRRTRRTEIMYAAGGVAYVYLCYGIHQMFNVVSATQNVPHAILIRALDPVAGTKIMLQRTGKSLVDNTLTRGPGNVCKALGIHTAHTGISLRGKELFICDDNNRIPEKSIYTSPRIGVDYAEADAALPYRFYVKGNPFVSGKMR